MNFIKKVSQIAAAAILLVPSLSSATEFGYWPWYAQISGQVSDQGRDIDLNSELGMRTSTGQGWLVDDGGLRLTYMPLNFTGSGVLTGSASFGGTEFSDSANVRSEADVTAMSARFLWNVTEHTELGFAVNILDGEVMMEDVDNDVKDSRTFSEVFPLLAMQYNRPLMDLLTLNVEANYIAFEDNWVLELQGALELETDPIKLRLGWHQKEIDVTDGDSGLDIKTNGLFAQILVVL